MSDRGKTTPLHSFLENEKTLGRAHKTQTNPKQSKNGKTPGEVAQRYAPTHVPVMLPDQAYYAKTTDILDTKGNEYAYHDQVIEEEPETEEKKEEQDLAMRLMMSPQGEHKTTATSEGKNPTSNGKNPTSDGKNPTSNGKNPLTNGKNPTSNGKKLARIPTAKDVFQQHSSAERINLYKESSTRYGEVRKVQRKLSVSAEVLDLMTNVNCSKLGWIPQISREETEELLKDSPPKTFILRWSDRMSSLVLSYTERPGKVHHIGWIFLQFPLGTTLDNIPVKVKQEDEKETTYTSIYSYLLNMEQRGTIEVSAVELYDS